MPLDDPGFRIGGTQPAGQRSPDRYIPYYDHVSDGVVRLKDGGHMAMIRLPAIPFYLSSNLTRNGAAGRHFVLLQLLADRHTEIVEHYVSHRHVPAFPANGQRGTDYAEAFMARYDASVLSHLRTREWFISIIVRPPAMSDRWLRAKWRAFRGLDPEADEWAVRTLEAKVRTALATLGRYGAVRLGTYAHRGFTFSEIGEALVFVRTLRRVRVPLTFPPGSFGHALYTDRVMHGALGFLIRQAGGETNAMVGRMFTLNPYPKLPRVGMFDDIHQTDVDLVITNSARTLSRAQATDQLELALARMTMSETRATTDQQELRDALAEIANAQEVRANHGFSVAVHAKDMPTLDEHSAVIVDTISGAGCSLVPEGLLGSEAAYWSQWPGNGQFRTRPATIGLKRFVRLSSLDGFPPTSRGSPRWGAPILRFATAGGTPYDHDLHDGQVGNILFCGPVGGGKTLAAAAMATAATRLIGDDGRIILIDKDRSNKLTIRANGGPYIELKRGEASGMAPLRRYQNTPEDREAASDLIVGMIRADDGPAPGPGVLARIAAGVAWVLRLPPERRTIGAVHAFLPPASHDPSASADRLLPWCAGEAKGWAFDGPEDLIDFERSRIVGVDLTALLKDDLVLPIAGTYLLNAAERVMDGRRVILWVEEGKFLLPKPYFSKRFEDVVLTGRKKNVAFWFVTQQPEHIIGPNVGHDLGASLLSQMRTRFLFKNEMAQRQAYCGGGDYGDGLHCTPQEYAQVKEGMTAGGWSVLIQRPGFSTLCRFDLSAMPEDIAVLSGTPKSVALWDRIAEEQGDDDPAAILPEFLSRLQEAAA